MEEIKPPFSIKELAGVSCKHSKKITSICNKELKRLGYTNDQIVEKANEIIGLPRKPWTINNQGEQLPQDFKNIHQSVLGQLSNLLFCANCNNELSQQDMKFLEKRLDKFIQSGGIFETFMAYCQKCWAIKREFAATGGNL